MLNVIQCIWIHPLILYSSRFCQICVKFTRLTFERQAGCFGDRKGGNSCAQLLQLAIVSKIYLFQHAATREKHPIPILDWWILSSSAGACFQSYICFNRLPPLYLYHHCPHFDLFNTPHNQKHQLPISDWRTWSSLSSLSSMQMQSGSKSEPFRRRAHI